MNAKNYYTEYSDQVRITAKENRQKTNQTSEQNQSRSGAGDSQSGCTPLQAESENISVLVDQTDTSGTGEAAAESSGVTYAQVTKRKKTSRNNGADADVAYVEIELKPLKKAKKVKEKMIFSTEAEVEHG
ncbi:Fc receptor-like protein 5, partial [Clarias magur]